jgi:hypothetical protein
VAAPGDAVPVTVQPWQACTPALCLGGMMTGQASMMLVPIICGLLLRYMEQTQALANMLRELGGSLVSVLWNILTHVYNSVISTDSVEGEGGSNTPLTDIS